MQMKKVLLVLWILPVVSGCTVDTSNARRLKLLALEECVDNRERSVGNQGKSHGLLFSECEQIQSITEGQQAMRHKKHRHSIPEEQEYFNEKTWSVFCIENSLISTENGLVARVRQNRRFGLAGAFEQKLTVSTKSDYAKFL